MKTGIIKYNVKDRGRQYRGPKRNFDAATLASIINGPEVQERVKNRDLHGYLGHWQRMDHGMEPPEGAIVGGKVVTLDTAFITTHLKAHPDGTIEHEAETLDNAQGRAVEGYLRSKTGGFSSAIRTTVRAGLDIPLSFHGFDYVREPNFTHNRPYALDSATEGDDEGKEFWMLDGVIVMPATREQVIEQALAEVSGQLSDLRRLFDSVTADHHLALETLEHLSRENNDLIGRIASSALDSANEFSKIQLLPKAAADAFEKIESFKTAHLAALDSVAPGEARPAVKKSVIQANLRKLGSIRR